MTSHNTYQRRIKRLIKTLRQLRHLPRLRRLNQIRQQPERGEEMATNAVNDINAVTADMSKVLSDYSAAMTAQAKNQAKNQVQNQNSVYSINYGLSNNTGQGYLNQTIGTPMQGVWQQVTLQQGPVLQGGTVTMQVASAVGAPSGVITGIEFVTADCEVVHIEVDANYITLLGEISEKHRASYKKHVEDFSLSDMEWAEQAIEEYGAKSREKAA